MSVPEVPGPGGAPPPGPPFEPPRTSSIVVRGFTFTGKLGEFFLIFIVNLALNIVTLTTFRFWGRTRVRRYLWSQGRLLDEPFEYTGSGLELFVGFVIVLILIILPMSLGYLVLDIVLSNARPEAQALLGMVAYPFFLFLLGVALYRARAYRLSRTLWRGIRMAQTGSSAAYGGYYAIFLLLSFMTLGWFVPEKNIRLWSILINNSYLGSERFRFERVTHKLYRPFAIAWLLCIPTLGLSFAWYKAAEIKFLVGATRFQDVELTLDVSGGRLLGFVLLNGIIIVLTLGLGGPFVQYRTAGFIAANLGLEGQPQLAAIAQSPWTEPGVGEGLAEAFGMGSV